VIKGRLPTYAEILSIAQSGIALSSSLLLDWTGDSTGDNTSIYVNNATPPDMDGERANSTASWARTSFHR
jgi:hypothetical protein